MRSGRRPPILLSLYAGLFLIFLYVPILLIPVFAFNDSTIVAFPFRAVTLRWFAELGRNPQLLEALNNSLVVGVVVAILSTAFGTLGAWVLTRYPMKGRGAVTGYIMLPIVAPLVVLAAALFVLVRSAGLELTLFTVGLGHLVLCIPFAFSVMRSRIESFDESLLLASRDLGEGRMGTFLRVVLPISAPGIVSSLLLTFTLSFDEFVLAFFLSSTEVTLPVYIWSQLRFPERLPVVLALGSLILLASFVLVTLGELFRRLRTSPDA